MRLDKGTWLDCICQQNPQNPSWFWCHRICFYLSLIWCDWNSKEAVSSCHSWKNVKDAIFAQFWACQFKRILCEMRACPLRTPPFSLSSRHDIAKSILPVFFFRCFAVPQNASSSTSTPFKRMHKKDRKEEAKGDLLGSSFFFVHHHTDDSNNELAKKTSSAKNFSKRQQQYIYDSNRCKIVNGTLILLIFKNHIV